MTVLHARIHAVSARFQFFRRCLNTLPKPHSGGTPRFVCVRDLSNFLILRLPKSGFSNTHTPSSLSTHLVRVVVPLESCEEAATYLVKALGGEDKAREVVGGFKWWQARTIKGCV
jgi:hypothetical protein